MSEISVKELFKQFKSTPWSSNEEYLQFLANMPTEVDGKTAKAMIELLTSDKEAATNDARHQMRIEIFKRVGPHLRNSALYHTLVKALTCRDSKVRDMMAALIPANNSLKDQPKLVALLKSSERPVRRSAAQVLRKIGGRPLLETLDKMIGDKDFTERGEALDLIVPMAGHHAIGILRTTIKEGAPVDQQKALQYLGDEKYMHKAVKQALESILPAIESSNELVSGAAISAFSALASEDDFWEFTAMLFESKKVAVVKAAVCGLRYFDSPRTMLMLERKLRTGPSTVRAEVLNTLESIGNDAVLPLLADALGHKELSVRKQAAEVLSRLSNDRKVDVARTIIWLLNSSNVEVRRMAVEVARQVKDPDNELWPRLLVMLRDEDWWVRERVMDALIGMAGDKLTPHMVAMLEDTNDVMRRFAVDVLMRLGDNRALGALINAAREDVDWWVKEKAIEAIAATGDQRAVSYIVDLMDKDSELSLRCVLALQELKAPSAAGYVAKMLTSKNADVRLAAVECLGAFDATDYAAQVQPLVADEDGFVSRAAQHILVKWNVRISEKYSDSRNKAMSFLDRMLSAVVEGNGDDLILSSDRKPYMKKMGRTVPISSAELTHKQIMAILTPQLTLAQMESLEAMRDVDYSYEVESSGERFRANVFRTEAGYSAVFRTISQEAPEIDTLGLPEVIKSFGDKKWGLVLVGGPTGSGKSTTLSALINYINQTRDAHIITIEDPIEVVHPSKKSLVTQRELGTHARSAADALRATLREDPDVILVGEMRDLETISFAVNAAETGHLVFGTLHTVSADTSIDRIINAYPSKEQDQIRATLADNLQAVVCQHLVKKKDGAGRTVVAEVMLNNDAIANLIRNGKTFQIQSVIATSKGSGMQSMDTELLHLYKKGIISSGEVYMKANSKKEVEDLMNLEDERRASGTSVVNGKGKRTPVVAAGNSGAKSRADSGKQGV